MAKTHTETATPPRRPRRPTRFPPDKAAELYRRLALERPDPRTELLYTTPFTLLVAVVLSAQMTDVGVNRATAELFKVADTPEKILALGEDRLAGSLKTVNFWRAKTRNVLALSRQLIERHGGAVPREREALEALPGVGRKTANVILLEIFREAQIAVDTHVFRVANRTGLAPGPTPEAVEQGLLAVTPEPYRLGAHHWLILHGRYTCIARKPKCPACVIRDLCLYPAKTPDLSDPDLGAAVARRPRPVRGQPKAPRPARASKA
jgi:endonuclease III